MNAPLLEARTLEETLAWRAEDRASGGGAGVRERVASIIERVRTGGSEALTAIAQELSDPQPRLVERDELERLAREVSAETRETMARATERVANVARAQMPPAVQTVERDGARTTLRCVPVEVGACYAPGGRYPLVSSVIMTVTPARVAGVDRAVVVCPMISPELAAAAVSADAQQYVVLGGAQAVAACAFGVAPAPRADVLVGPGNKWVAEAKRQLFGAIGVEGVAGPSEVCVVADASSDPALIAADLLAQAEHDTDAEALLVAVGDVNLDDIDAALRCQLDEIDTRDVARSALNRRGGVISASDEAHALDIVDALAPEHLVVNLPVDAARAFSARVRHAGAIFVGEGSAEALGDYGAGPNHTLPTGGAARFQQALSPLAFVRQRAELEMIESRPDLVRDVEHLARLERLPAHEMAARLRRERMG